MRATLAAAVLILAACATIPPLRPADPAQAVPNEKLAGTAFAEGVRIVVRPGAWRDGDVEQYLTTVEVAIHNGSERVVQVHPASFSLLAPGGFRYQALSPEDLRRVLGPMRGGGYGYAFLPPWGAPLGPWGGPYGAWWRWNGFGPSPWWGPVVYYGGPSSGRIPSRALARGSVDPGGDAAVLLFFPVPAEQLNALEVDASLADASGQKIADLRVPFVRPGARAPPMPLPPTASPPPPPPAQPPPAQPPST